MLNLIASQAAALQHQQHQHQQQQQQGFSSTPGINGASANPPTGPPPPREGIQKGALHFHPMRWKSSAPSFMLDVTEEAMKPPPPPAASDAAAAAGGGWSSFAASGAPSTAVLLREVSDPHMHASASSSFGQSRRMHSSPLRRPPVSEKAERGGPLPKGLGPSEEGSSHAADEGLQSYKTLLSRSGQCPAAFREYELRGLERPRSEPVGLVNREKFGKSGRIQKWDSFSETPRSFLLLKEESDTMERMLRAHKEHENAVVSLMKRLELSREEKQKRSDDFKKRLVVPPPPPPPLIPMRLGRVSKTREISEEEAKAAKRLFRHSKGSFELIEKFNIPISVDVLRCLEGSNWLNDEVINFYFVFNLLNFEHISDVIASLRSVCRCFFFSTFFYSKLSGPGDDESTGYNYEGVKRWTRRQKVDIFEKDLIFIPLHLGQLHWTLGVIDMRQGKESIRFFDSLGGRHKPLAGRMRRYLQDEHKDKKGTPLQEHRSWYALPNGEPERGTPQQQNGFDCGVFLCQIAECISDGREFDFDQRHISNMRLKMALDIVKGSLDF
ncbi:hypothetical protein Esti_002132 [Eimeria stiedai]